MTFLWIVLALAALYLFLIAPALKKPDDSALRGWLYAHRGLHDGNRQVPENSMEAFRRAAESGYGIELDVHLTRDGRLVVHHDGSLKRVCGVDRRIRDLTYQELCAIPLPDSSVIPLFTQVLSLVDGRVPLIVEVKHESGAAAVAQATLETLRTYRGPCCVESFHPLAVRYFRKHAPDIVRGQLAMGYPWKKGESSRLVHFGLKSLLINALGRPHFIAYSVPDDHSLSMWLMKHVFHPYLAGWTIRSQQVLDDALNQGYRYPIFELFCPAKKESQNGRNI